MKKPYVKPVLAFEPFQLNAAIASNCAVTSTNQSVWISCGYVNGIGEHVFCSPYKQGCNDKFLDLGSYNDPYDSPDLGRICRHASANSGYPALFSS